MRYGKLPFQFQMIKNDGDNMIEEIEEIPNYKLKNCRRFC